MQAKRPHRAILCVPLPSSARTPVPRVGAGQPSSPRVPTLTLGQPLPEHQMASSVSRP